MIRVLLLDDHVVVRTGYRRLLDAEPDLQVVGEAASAEEANTLVQCTEPNVALVDLCLKGSSGIEAIGGMLARRPELKILVLSMYDSPGHVTQALRAGALGYMTKFSDPVAVIAGIRRAAKGHRAYSHEVAEILAREQHAGNCPLSDLTPREFEVLRLLVHGETPIGIATSMHLSRKTIFNYLSMIRQKLDTDTDFQLLRLAARHGLLEERSLAS